MTLLTAAYLSTPQGCPNAQICIPMPSNSHCPAVCPVSCGINDPYETHVVDMDPETGCIMGEHCVPGEFNHVTSTACHGVGPVHCAANQTYCDTGYDANGCKMMDMCVDNDPVANGRSLDRSNPASVCPPQQYTHDGCPIYPLSECSEFETICFFGTDEMVRHRPFTRLLT